GVGQRPFLHEERRAPGGARGRALGRRVVRLRAGGRLLGGGQGLGLGRRFRGRALAAGGSQVFGLGRGGRRAGGEDDLGALRAGDVLEELVGGDDEGMAAGAFHRRLAVVHGAFLAG